MSHPEIHVKDWIDVGNSECVVQRLLPPGSPSGVCIVVFNKTKPTTRIVGWDGKKWYFMPSRDYGGYADDWIGPYVSIHFLSLNPLLVRRRRYSRGERYPSALCGCHSL